LRSIGFFTASAFLANTTYAVVAQVWGNDWVLVAIFVWMLTSLFKAFFQFTKYRNRLTTAESYLVVLPISVFTGWVTLAILVNTASALKTSGFDNFGLSEGTWTILLLLVAGLIGSYLTFFSRGNVGYALTFIWGLIGIVIANLTRNSNLEVAIVAGGVAILIALVLLRARSEAHKKAQV
jgi:translocator protein